MKSLSMYGRYSNVEVVGAAILLTHGRIPSELGSGRAPIASPGGGPFGDLLRSVAPLGQAGDDGDGRVQADAAASVLQDRVPGPRDLSWAGFSAQLGDESVDLAESGGGDRVAGALADSNPPMKKMTAYTMNTTVLPRREGGGDRYHRPDPGRRRVLLHHRHRHRGGQRLVDRRPYLGNERTHHVLSIIKKKEQV